MLGYMKETSGGAMLPAILEGREVHLHLTRAAQQALQARATPLVAELELYFSCLIRKRVLFKEDAAAATPVSEKLSLRFRPVAGKRCDLHSVEGEQPLEDFPVVRRGAFVPHWVRLDYRKGAWSGEFGYSGEATA